MQLYEPLGEREADAEAALSTVSADIELREHLEYLRELRIRYADAGVAHAHDCVVTFTGDGHGDAPATRCVLGRIVEEVRNHLGDTRRIDNDHDRLGRRHEDDLLRVRLDHGLAA